MDSDFVEYVLRQLRVLGPVVARPMFGAHGLYCDERMFGIVDNEVLFLKVSAVTRLDYVSAGMGPFSPLSSKKPMESYYELPLDVLESREKLVEWGRKALEAASGSQPAKPAAKTGDGAGAGAGAKAGGKSAAKSAAKKGDSKSSAVDALENLGEVSQRWLADAGIRTRADLERVGSVAAFKKVAEAGHKPSANLLYALEGALLDLRWDRLSEEIKQNLIERAGLAAPKKPAKPGTRRTTKRSR